MTKSTIPPIRALVGAGLIVLFSLGSAIPLLVEQYKIHQHADPARNDQASVFEARMAGVRQALPLHSTVGFLTDVPESSGRSTVLYLTQYSLAPRVVADNTLVPLVIGNFFSSVPSPALLEKMHLRPSSDFGNGVVLYQRYGDR
jgi:hypothetical protein